jgi:tRNA pseudouridine55 synthase
MAVKQMILNLYKKRGETPLECLERFKIDNPEYINEKMTYAGRLDPLAEGLLLVLVGEECKNKDKYLGLDKTYEVDVLFGFSTDTYDILGKVLQINKNKHLKCEDGFDYTDVEKFQCINKDIKAFIGKFSQKYPPFSSKTIRGKSLFSLFKSGELKDEEIPEKEVEIKDIKIVSGRTISKNDLEKYIKESVNLVKGDFRQGEILNIWDKAFNSVIPVQTGIHNLDPRICEDDKNVNQFMVVSIKVDCTSGTYMRSLANSFGEKVGIPALALNIKRIKVGDFNI